MVPPSILTVALPPLPPPMPAPPPALLYSLLAFLMVPLEMVTVTAPFAVSAVLSL